MDESGPQRHLQRVGRDMPAFAHAFTSGEDETRGALAAILDYLAPLELEPEERGTVEIVLGEVLNNVVEHAYPAGTPAGEVRVQCNLSPRGLIFEIEDDGQPMPDGQAPLGKLHDLKVDMHDLPEGGFGWFLIHNLAREVAYQRDGGRNRLHLRIGITPSA